MTVKVIVIHTKKEIEYLKFKGLLHLLDYQINLSIEELDEIESFKVYLE